MSCAGREVGGRPRNRSSTDRLSGLELGCFRDRAIDGHAAGVVALGLVRPPAEETDGDEFARGDRKPGDAEICQRNAPRGAGAGDDRRSIAADRRDTGRFKSPASAGDPRRRPPHPSGEPGIRPRSGRGAGSPGRPVAGRPGRDLGGVGTRFAAGAADPGSGHRCRDSAGSGSRPAGRRPVRLVARRIAMAVDSESRILVTLRRPARSRVGVGRPRIRCRASGWRAGHVAPGAGSGPSRMRPSTGKSGSVPRVGSAGSTWRSSGTPATRSPTASRCRISPGRWSTPRTPSGSPGSLRRPVAAREASGVSFASSTRTARRSGWRLPGTRSPTPTTSRSASAPVSGTSPPASLPTRRCRSRATCSRSALPSGPWRWRFPTPLC